MEAILRTIIENLVKALIAVGDQRDALLEDALRLQPDPRVERSVQLAAGGGFANPPARPTYQIPNPPPVESELEDTRGVRWRITRDPLNTVYAECISPTVGIDDVVEQGDMLSWPNALTIRGPLTLLDQDSLDKALYGPWGARWGSPARPCPYPDCALALNHSGPHLDAATTVIGATQADGTTINPSITPHEASETPCTCGHPDAHQPTCPRFQRLQGHES